MMAEYSQTYWNELIDQYRNGTISKRDRFQLEKQALDDPFLFDALEGFSLYDDGVNENSEDKTSVKIFTLPRIAIAASIVLLVGFLFNMNFNSNPQMEGDSTIAMVLEEDEQADEAEKKQGSGINSMVSNSAEPEVSNAPEQILPVKEDPPNRDSNTGGDDIKKDSPGNEDKQKNSRPSKEVVETNEQEAINDDEISDNIIVEVDLPEGNVDELTVGQTIEEVADAGNIDTEAKDEDAQMIVPVESKSDVKNEVESKKRKVKTNSYFEAVPVIGKEIFDDYAKERIDKRGLRQAKPQEVTIEFTIDKNGNLSNFHHIFTGCPECGPFAISILQNSGEWKTVPPGFSGKARYTFVF